MKEALQILLILTAALSSIQVVASDFNFQVPIDLRNLHADITQGKVRCVASSNESAPWSGGYSQIGIGESIFAISGGQHRGTVNVAFDAGASANPASARVWACNLMLHTTVRGWMPAELMIGGGPRPPYERDRSVPVHTQEQGSLR